MNSTTEAQRREEADDKCSAHLGIGDWRYRLLAMNSGLPIHEQSPRCRYSRTLQALVGKLEMQQDDVTSSSWWQRVRSNG